MANHSSNKVRAAQEKGPFSADAASPSSIRPPNNVESDCTLNTPNISLKLKRQRRILE